MTNAKFRIKNGLELIETTGSAGTLTLVDGQIDSDQGLFLDAVGDITLDADGGEVFFAHAGVNHGQINNNGDDMVIRSLVSDGNMVFRGNDGGVNTAVLTLNMASAGAATFNAGITLGGNITGPDNLDMVIAPQDGNYIDIDGALKVTPAQAPHVNRTYSTTGGSSGSRTTLTTTTAAFADFPQSGFVKIQGMSAGEQPYAYTRTSDTVLTSTGSTFDDLTSTTGAITLVPQATKINGGAAPSNNTGQFSHDGGQITLDGGKWGTANNNFAIGAMYGSVILQGGTSVKKLTAADNASGKLYKADTHGGPNNMIPILHVGGENQSMTAQEDYFTGQGKSIIGGSSSSPNETVYYNFKVAADALAMMKVKSKVANVADADGDSRIGTAIVSESASAGSMNGMYFNVDDTAHSLYLSHGNGGSIGAVDYNFGVGHLYNGAVGTTQVFAMGYGSRSFNNGTSLANSSFTTGSSTFGAQGNSLATQNTFFQASIAGQVGIGPAQTPTTDVTLTIGRSGEDNSGIVGGVIAIDAGASGIGPNSTSGKLYNKDGSLYWGDTNLSASSASNLGDLGDVTFSSGNLVIDALDLVSPSATAQNVAGTALVIQGGTTTAGTTNNIAGGSLTLAGGQGKGSGAGGDIIFQVANQGSSGSSLNSLAEVARIADHGYFGIGTATPTSHLSITSTAASGATGGASIILAQDDGATTASGHRLGVIDFAGAEDSSGTLTVGARIQALAEEAFDATNNDTKLEFYTTTGNSSSTLALTLKNDSTALFSGAAAPIADDGSALGTSSLNWSDLFLADGAVVNLGDDQDVTLTHYADNGLLLNSTRKLYFEDGSNYDQFIGSAGSGITAVGAPTEIDLTAPTLDINASTEVNIDTPSFVLTSSTTDKPDMVIKNTNDDATGPSLTFTLDTSSSAAANDVAGTISFVADDAGNNQTEYGRVQVKANAVTGGSESGKILFGVATTDSGAYADVMTITGGADAAGSTVEVAGSLSVVGDLNITGDVNSTSVTDLDVVDKTITVASGATNSSDSNASGITFGGSGATLQYIHATTSINVNKPLILTGTTESSSATTGELIVAGGAGIAKDLSVGDDLRLTSDASVFSMGNGADITITHDNSTGGTLASAGAFIIDGEDDLTLDVGDGKDVLLLEAGTAYASIGQGSVDIADILDTAGATDIDTFTCTTYQATKYIILVEDVTNANYMTTEILLLGDENGGSDAEPYLTQYAVVFNDHELGVFAATGSGNTVTLTYDPTDDGVSGDDNHKVRVVATRIASI